MKHQQTESAQVDRKSDPTFLSLQSTHARAEHWLADAEFYMEEIMFLQKLVSQNFVNIFSTGSPGRPKSLIEELESLQHRGDEIKTLIKELLLELKEAVMGPLTQDVEPIQDKVRDLEVSQSDFVKTFRAVKRDVFRLTERAIKAGSINPLSEKPH